MKKRNDGGTMFSRLLARFFSMLRNERGCSQATIDTYGYAFVLFFRFMKAVHGIDVMHLGMAHFTRDNVTGFYDWLEMNGASVSTRNNRRAALSAFAKFAACEDPEHSDECLRVAAVPSKRTQKPIVDYVTVEGLKCVRSMVDTTKDDGLRDWVMLTFLFISGIRVSELVGIRICDLWLGRDPCVKVVGKGGKSRAAMLVPKLAGRIVELLKMEGRYGQEHSHEWLFRNHNGGQLTRFGVNYIVKKYADEAHRKDPSLVPAKFSTHSLRHSAAMAQIESGATIFEVRDSLGHSSVTTTEIYAKAASIGKRKDIIGKVSAGIDEEPPMWVGDEAKAFLSSLLSGAFH